MKHILTPFLQTRGAGAYFLNPKVHRSLFSSMPLRMFSSSPPNNKGHPYNDEQVNFDEATKQRMLERERAVYNSLPEKEKQYFQAYRLALVKSMEESWNDPKNWWNKFSTMTDDEIETLPNEYIRKFGSFIIRYQEMQQVAHIDVNQSLNGMYDQVKKLD